MLNAKPVTKFWMQNFINAGNLYLSNNPPHVLMYILIALF